MVLLSMKKFHVFKNKGALIQEYVRANQKVLDVGFTGQGMTDAHDRWPHSLIKRTGADVYGVDLSLDRTQFTDKQRYQEASAESFNFPGIFFDVIFAGDLIEHLPNPGLFLETCKKHLKDDGLIIVTTPNCFNLFNLAEKLSKDEPTVNADHTCYFNHKTLKVLMRKMGFEPLVVQYIYSLEYEYAESAKKKLLNILYWWLSLFTPKFSETLVMVAKRD